MSITVIEQTNRLTVSPGEPTTLMILQATPRVTVTTAGVQGPPGPQGPAGDSAELGFVFHQSNPVTTVQINHGLVFQPAGVVCLGSGDTIPLLGVEVSYPFPGYIELSFGVLFTGTIYLS